MTREEEIRKVARFNATKFSTRYGYTTPEEACVQTALWADAHPKNPWHTINELPEPDPAMVSRGFNLSLPVLLCDVENLTCYAGARYHYDPARYDFDKKQWKDIVGYCDEEIGITHTHWMYQPEPPKE